MGMKNAQVSDFSGYCKIYENDLFFFNNYLAPGNTSGGCQCGMRRPGDSSSEVEEM